MAMRHLPTITTHEAEQALAACLADARERQAAVTVAIVDAGGAVLTLHRMDGARPYTVDLATRKARTAAAVGLSTRIIAAAAAPGTLSGEALALPGGLPFMAAERAAGAIGISGADVETDEAIAAAGVRVITEAGL